MKYPKIICGGTFDLFHIGHKYFLQKIIDQSEKVIIGLTSNKYVQENKPDKGVASFEIRKKEIEQFLNEKGINSKVKIVPINDMYGPLLDFNLKVDAIAVSQSYENAVKINKKRKEKGLNSIKIIQIEMKRGEDGRVVSSSRIRKGEIDREGNLYIKRFWVGKKLLLPPTLRYLLQDVWGEIISGIPEDINLEKIITVGDVVTGEFIKNKKIPKLSIIDNKVERTEKKFSQDLQLNTAKMKIKNPPGTISWELFKAIQKALAKDQTLIEIEGEEDLSVLPALLCAPLEFKIFYGQPRIGMIKLDVTEKNKDKARILIDRFKPD